MIKDDLHFDIDLHKSFYVIIKIWFLSLRLSGPKPSTLQENGI